MSEPTHPSKVNPALAKILADWLRSAGIAPESVQDAPQLPEEAQTEQLETYEGRSDHSSIVEQLAEKEEERDQEKKRADDLAYDLAQLKFNERYDLHELRRTYTPYLFYMTVGWLGFVAALVTLNAFGLANLSDAVLVALITTTTANVIGMFLVAARWLFPSKNK